MTRWNILYRGPLSSCNYDCHYCPFAKTRSTPAEVSADRASLERFTAWVATQVDRSIGVLFTPWGEALVHQHYRDAMLTLAALPNVYRVAVQTNLSADVVFLAEAAPDKVALWASYHPEEVSEARFLSRCGDLDRTGTRYSVGAVGLREYLPAIESLRARLNPNVYLWINAYKDEGTDYYDAHDLARLMAIDPYFGLNRQDYGSAGRACAAGHTSFTVDGDGDARRCHFIDDVIGNIHDARFEQQLHAEPCTRQICDCHIGYVHRPELDLYRLFGDGVLERIPAAWPRVDDCFTGGGRSALQSARGSGHRRSLRSAINNAVKRA